MEKIEISWKTFLSDVDSLSMQIPEGQFITIVAITKGGLIPAYFLAKKLKINIVHTFNASSYDDKTRKEVVVHTPPIHSDGENWLIVDDLIDSGATIQKAKEFYPKAQVATVYRKPYSPEVDFWVDELSSWVIFPWEL